MKLGSIGNYASKLGFRTRLQQTDEKRVRLSISLEIIEYSEISKAWSCRMASQEMLDKLDKYLKRYKVKFSYGGNYLFVYQDDKTY